MGNAIAVTRDRAGPESYLVPNRRSPASPSPGRMYPCASRQRSRAAATIDTSGKTLDTFATPSGAADKPRELDRASRHFLEPRDRRHRGAAGGEHRVDQDHVALCEIVGQL